MPSSPSAEERRRLEVRVRGIVQGVGFRPFAWSLARSLGLGGVVRNGTDGVCLEIEGEGAGIDRFLLALRADAPPLARIDTIEQSERTVRGETDFRIEASEPNAGAVAFVTPDAATCADCLRELFDPNDRRNGHCFSSCTACGPRLTIATSVPYDRERTTMAGFPMCEDCRAEYDDPADRRFHAQPIACPACGPRLAWVATSATSVTSATSDGDLVEHAAAALARGAILAVKGLGGYHLVCDARDENAVAELRRRKRRDARPFAVMVSDASAAARFCEISPAEAALLESAACPIVLLRRDPGGPLPVAPSIAPGLDRVGVMLPYTPLHHRLLDAAPFPLVMTSGNTTDEPIAYDDDDARCRLSPLSDGMLVHDRPIQIRCDDSIAHVIDGAPSVLRRSRGYAPAPLGLPARLARPTLALGGHSRTAFALGAETHAFPSHHLGDLDDFEAWRAYRAAIDHYQALFGITPERIAHDLHPDYATTALAKELARDGRERVAVQHHEAHVASCLAENGITGEAIGVAFDGAGWGRDGAIWGGEIFLGSCGRARRVAHVRYVGLPGGDRAAREPWRMAVAQLLAAGVEVDESSFDRVSRVELRAVRAMLERGTLAPRTSSVGRLFDAAAAIARVRSRVAHEAQAAMELQCLAERCTASSALTEPYGFELHRSAEMLELDPRHLFRELARDVAKGADTSVVARRFHATLAAMTTAACVEIRTREERGPCDVALSGGVFANALLVRDTAARLRAAGFRVHVNRAVPTNDGGLAFGQLAAIAATDGG